MTQPTQPRQWLSSLAPLLDVHLGLLLPSSALLHVYLSPYTKVEESFNTQALHDWLFLGPWRIDEFDHITFPGAVPRSFIPSIVLSSFSYPILLVLKLLRQIQTTADVQYHLRCILALLWSAALLFFIHRLVPRIQIPYLVHQAQTVQVRRSIKRSLLVLSACQFHLPFWAGRTTPNGLAMPALLVALALILPRGLAQERKQLTGIALLAFLAIVYRLELLGLLGGCGLYLVHSRISVWREDTDPHPIESIGKIAAITQSAATISALLTLTVDTSIWRSSEWIIPEIAAMKFNVLEGKSADWGTSPWYFYLSSSLPRLLSFSTPLTVIGAFLALAQAITSSQGTRPLRQALRGRFSQIDNEKAQAAVSEASVPLAALLLLAGLHVGLLSTVAHKEWRFVAYTVPLLNTLAAVGASLFLSPTSYRGMRNLPSTLTKLLPLIPLSLLGLTVFTTMVSVRASIDNYPGGIALARLHQNELEQGRLKEPHHIHIDVLPAMTGVTLFQSVHLARPQDRLLGVLPSLLAPTTTTSSERILWTYDKSEDLPLTLDAWGNFTHLISVWPECQSPMESVGIDGPAGGVGNGQRQVQHPTWEPISGARGGASAVEFAGIDVQRLSPRQKVSNRDGALKEDDGGAAKRPLSLNLPLLLPSIRSFTAVQPSSDQEGVRTRVKGVAIRWGRDGSGLTVGIKTRDAVWICQRRRGDAAM